MLRLISSQDKQGRYPGAPCLLGSPLRARHFGPTLQSVPHFLAILRRGQQMTSRSEVLGNRPGRREKPLRMAGRFEPLHAILALTRWPMGVLIPVAVVLVSLGVGRRGHVWLPILECNGSWRGHRRGQFCHDSGRMVNKLTKPLIVLPRQPIVCRPQAARSPAHTCGGALPRGRTPVHARSCPQAGHRSDGLPPVGHTRSASPGLVGVLQARVSSKEGFK